MSKNVMKSSAVDKSPWMEVEDVGVQIGMVKNALQVGSWALRDQDDCIGGCADEMTDYFIILQSFLDGLTTRCESITDRLLSEKKAREGVA